MKANEFSLLGTELGFTAYGSLYCGVIYGWPVMLHNARFIHAQFFVDRKKDRASMRQLEEILKTWGGRVYSWMGNLVTITAASAKKMQGSRADYIGFCCFALTCVGLRPLDHCPYCGARFCDAAAMTRKGYRLTHFRCLRAAADDAQNRADDNRQRGSFLLGLPGAILGMLVGTLPTFLTVYYLGMEYSLFFALIPICTYLGYKLFGGKMDKSALILSIVLSILAVFFLNIELFIASMMQMYGASLREVLGILPQVLADPETWLVMVSNSAQEFLFTALGIWVAWRLISTTDSGTAYEAAAALRLAQRWDGQETATVGKN